MGFIIAWVLAAAALVLLAGAMGKRTGEGRLGLLLDDRGRYSLNHLQILMWTILVLSSLLAQFIASGFTVASLAIPDQLLVLMGISVGSAVGSGAIKAEKDARPGVTVARRGTMTLEGGETKEISPRLSQVFLLEEGRAADEVVDVTKFQNLVLTLVAGLAYVVLTARLGGLPELPEQVLWLIGISHAGYLGGKLPGRG